jgi:mono/diheme cytochrome c family protein
VTPPTPPPDEGFKEKELASDIDVSQVHGSILRERAEPCDGYEPIPLWLITLFFGIIFWAGLYLAYFSGGFRADIFNPDRVAWAGGGTTKPEGPVDPKVLGKRVFTQNCVVCHQTTGLGVAGQFPPLVGSEWVVGGDWHGDNHLVKILLLGLQGPVQVKGAAYNNAMPPWAQLSDEQISAVLTYIRSEWGNSAPAISTDYVKKIREATTGQTEPWSQKALQEIPGEKAPDASAPSAAPATPEAAPTAAPPAAA